MSAPTSRAELAAWLAREFVAPVLESSGQAAVRRRQLEAWLQPKPRVRSLAERRIAQRARARKVRWLAIPGNLEKSRENTRENMRRLRAARRAEA